MTNTRSMASQFRGVTQLDTLVSLASIAILVGLAFAVRPIAQEENWLSKEAARARAIHQSCLIWARGEEGVYPMPSALTSDGSDNTTANFYSLLLMNRNIQPTILIAPSDRNPNVRVDSDYDYDLYDPEGVWWDSTFVADLEDGSNVSFSHLVLYGDRVSSMWREVATKAAPVITSRGPKDGDCANSVYSCKDDTWRGIAVWNDGTLKRLKSLDSACWADSETKDSVEDCLFRMGEADSSNDRICAFTLSYEDKGPILQFD